MQEEIYEKVGKKENIVSVAHCSTRLRLVLADNEKCDAKQVEEIDGVKGVFSASGQIQIILGTGVVNKVYDEFLSISGLTGASTEEAKAAATAKTAVVQTGHQDTGRHFRSDHSGHCSQRISHGYHGSPEFHGKQRIPEY